MRFKVVEWKSDVVELVLGGPAPRQRRLVLVDHRVQDFQSLVDGQVRVLASAQHLEAVSVDAVAAVAAAAVAAAAGLRWGHLHNKKVPGRQRRTMKWPKNRGAKKKKIWNLQDFVSHGLLAITGTDIGQEARSYPNDWEKDLDCYLLETEAEVDLKLAAQKRICFFCCWNETKDQTVFFQQLFNLGHIFLRHISKKAETFFSTPWFKFDGRTRNGNFWTNEKKKFKTKLKKYQVRSYIFCMTVKFLAARHCNNDRKRFRAT